MLRPIAISSLIVSICLLFVDDVSMAPLDGVWEVWWTVLRLSPPLQEGGGVAILSDHNPIAAHLSVPVLLTQGVAEVPCAVLITGVVLPRGRGADHIVAVHRLVSFDALSMAPIGGQWGSWWTVPQLAQRSG